ncbi:hypothetical protein [Candidatus Curculioniphilus buchneri]|uniref:hypothetical protein n=1 Tax=Candidatus Curculioniphilus buchneri TaxID=690594 RepID=UPI00376EEA68
MKQSINKKNKNNYRLTFKVTLLFVDMLANVEEKFIPVDVVNEVPVNLVPRL